MFDYTRLARAFAFVFLGYFAGFPVFAVLEAILAGGFHRHWLEPLFSAWSWPAPCLFPALSVVLAVDFFRRLSSHSMTTTQLGGHRMSAALLAAGAAMSLWHSWVPTAVSGACLLLVLAPVKKRAAPSTWTPSGSTTRKA